MRKTTLITGSGCLLACALFLLVPAFRQAVRVSLTQWHDVFHVTSWQQKPGLDVLGRRARERGDAEAMAFVAVRHWDAEESARLAEDAVRLDPKLIWVYAIVAVRHPGLPEIAAWVPKLRQWDPQNALPHFITAESIDIAQVTRGGKVPQRADEEDPAWKTEMAAVSQSQKLDEYSHLQKELDRRVVLRFGLQDPEMVMSGEEQYGLPTYGTWDSFRYAKFLVEEGEKLESQGDHVGASGKYWSVVRLGQMMGPDSLFIMSPSIQDAYKRLGGLAEQEGKNDQARLLGYLAGKLHDAREKEIIAWRNNSTELTIAGWSASVVRASGLLILVFIGFAGISLVSGPAQKGFKVSNASHASGLIQGLGLVSALGLVVSCATLYVSYRPYAYIFRRFISTGDERGIRELYQFLDSARSPLGVHNFGQMRDFVFYFWVGATLLGLVVVLMISLRLYLSRSRVAAMA
ncbi:MAG TPA: hypothetical protein VG028_06475 [Terriglobia bacterium]|nr:hypothetical protein [Terriglobia bacterium]